MTNCRVFSSQVLWQYWRFAQWHCSLVQDLFRLQTKQKWDVRSGKDTGWAPETCSTFWVRLSPLFFVWSVLQQQVTAAHPHLLKATQRQDIRGDLTSCFYSWLRVFGVDQCKACNQTLEWIKCKILDWWDFVLCTITFCVGVCVCVSSCPAIHPSIRSPDKVHVSLSPVLSELSHWLPPPGRLMAVLSSC